MKTILQDITTSTDDCIVNSANTALIAGSGVCGAIHRKAGPELEKESKKYAPLAVGEVISTSAYNLPSRHIIHTIAPRYLSFDFQKEDEGNRSKEELLADCYAKSLDMARTLGAQSITFPLLGVGICGWSEDEAVGIAIDSVKRWQKDNDDALAVSIAILENRLYDILVDHGILMK
jgi:O-acetyl-ADP-ribose deacetylase